MKTSRGKRIIWNILKIQNRKYFRIIRNTLKTVFYTQVYAIVRFPDVIYLADIIKCLFLPH